MLIDEIIQMLSGEKAQLTDALLKTKVLLHQIGKRELVAWVNHELNGYPDNVELPEYRILQSKLLGNVSNHARRLQEQPLPLSHLTPEHQDDLIKVNFRQSLSILESFKSEGTFSRDIMPECYAILEKPFANGFRIERAWCQTPIHDVRGILTQVRSRLLDFILDLKETIGEAENDEAARSMATNIDAKGMLRHAVFGSVGDNATIIMGGQNAFSIQNEVQKGDMDSLVKTLRKSGIPDDAVSSLRAAISSDEAEQEVSISKGKTGAWLLNLIESAAKGGLKMGTDVVVRVATDALTAYIGG